VRGSDSKTLAADASFIVDVGIVAKGTEAAALFGSVLGVFGLFNTDRLMGMPRHHLLPSQRRTYSRVWLRPASPLASL